MLSYQHLYHAGNPADVHKHALLAWILAYLTQKPKPISYIETHAGRGLYDLDAPEALKTGEAAEGIDRMLARFDPAHPYAQTIARCRATQGAGGARAYPGSPWIASSLLRDGDAIHLCERHPAERGALERAMLPFAARVHGVDGFSKAHELTPPTPRRGMMLIDPSYETASDYADMPRFINQIARKWNVGIIALWYPILTDARHGPMLCALRETHPEAANHTVAFPPARPGHRMVGSGLFVVNAPWGFDAAAQAVSDLFDNR